MSETREFTCDICGGPLGQQRCRGFPPICSKCEMESIHETPGLSSPYLDSYSRLRDLRNSLAEVFRYLEDSGEPIIEGDPIAEVIDQLLDLIETFKEIVVKPIEEWAVEEVDRSPARAARPGESSR